MQRKAKFEKVRERQQRRKQIKQKMQRTYQCAVNRDLKCANCDSNCEKLRPANDTQKNAKNQLTHISAVKMAYLISEMRSK
jgi:hypothetical protein